MIALYILLGLHLIISAILCVQVIYFTAKKDYHMKWWKWILTYLAPIIWEITLIVFIVRNYKGVNNENNKRINER